MCGGGSTNLPMFQLRGWSARNLTGVIWDRDFVIDFHFG